jgi:hypothetical protein
MARAVSGTLREAGPRVLDIGCGPASTQLPGCPWMPGSRIRPPDARLGIRSPARHRLPCRRRPASADPARDVRRGSREPVPPLPPLGRNGDRLRRRGRVPPSRRPFLFGSMPATTSTTALAGRELEPGFFRQPPAREAGATRNASSPKPPCVPPSRRHTPSSTLPTAPSTATSSRNRSGSASPARGRHAVRARASASSSGRSVPSVPASPTGLICRGARPIS